ncbi:hypothetical protein SNE40_011274 [Patella caerulea]|uniref:Disks large-associated protein 5 n=1 Tax=Patella caerulea TaxID=87958 RepID=A0AAN8JJD5_PATCE
MESNYSDAYKIKSVTVDKRLVRSQRRSIDWKNQRQQQQEKRRAIEDLSPLQEIFHNSALSSSRVTNDTPSRKPGKSLGLKNGNGKQPGEDRKSQLSKWKQEKEAKRKIEALEKARNMPFKVGKIERKDETLYSGFKQSSKRQPMEPARKPVESKPKDRTKPTNSLKRKGDELQPSISKRSNLDSRTSKPPENKLKPTQRREVRRTVTKPRASPARRTTRQTTSGVNRLLAPTASTAAKKVDKTNGSAKVRTTEPQSKSKVHPMTNRISKNQPTTPSSDVNVPDKNLSKVTTVRGDFGFPNDFTFVAPSNLKSYIFNPLSPTSAADFLFPNQETSSYSFFNSSPQNGRCSTPRGEIEDKDGKKSADPKFNFTNHTQGKQNNECGNNEGEFSNVIVGEAVVESKKSADDESDENTILEKTLVVSEEAKTLESSDKSSDSESEKPKIRKSNRQSQVKKFEANINNSLVTSKTENTPTQAKNIRHALRSNTSTTKTESDTEQSTSEDETKRSTRSRKLRKSTCSTNRDEITATTSEDSSGVHSDHPSTSSDESMTKVLSSTVLSMSVDKLDNTVFAKEQETKKSSDIDIKEDIAVSVNENGSAYETGSFQLASLSESVDCKTEKESLLSSQPAQENEITQNGEIINLPDKGAEVNSLIRTDGWAQSAGTVVCKDDSFRTPGAPMSAQRRTRRKTVASSMPAKARSPEEWVKILERSPMIEMNRRTPKQKSPGLSDNVIQPLNFDDIEDDIPHITSNAVTNNKPVEIDNDRIEVEEMETEDTATCVNQESENHDVEYFRNKTQSETDKLIGLGDEWSNYMKDNNNLSEEVEGSIRTVVGQGQLLMDQRFKQFLGLVDNCEFKRGEKETTVEDLQGFWDMIYFQVEDVHKKFEALVKRKDNNWVEENKEPMVKKTIKKKAKCIKPAAKSKFAAFRAQMAKQKREESVSCSPQVADVKTFDAGFFKVNSPVKLSPHFHCEAGTPRKSKVEPVVNTSADDSKKIDKDTNDEEEKKDTGAEKELDNSSPKRQPLEPLSPNDARTPRRRSYAPIVPSPLLHDITPKPKTRRSLAVNTPKRLLSEVDVCPLSVTPKPRRKTLNKSTVEEITTPIAITIESTTPKSSQKISKSTPKLKEEATPKRRSLRLRKSVCFSETPSKQEPIPEWDDLSSFFQPTTKQDTPNKEESSDDKHGLIDSPFNMHCFIESQSASKSSTKDSSSKRRSLKRRPSDERRRRSSRRSVHFDKSPKQLTSDRLPHTPYNRVSLGE